MLVWSESGCPGYGAGTLKDYITIHYPRYASAGLFTWEDIYNESQQGKDSACNE